MADINLTIGTDASQAVASIKTFSDEAIAALRSLNQADPFGPLADSLDDASRSAQEFVRELAGADLEGFDADKFDISETLRDNLQDIEKFSREGALSAEQAAKARLVANQRASRQITDVVKRETDASLANARRLGSGIGSAFRGIFDSIFNVRNLLAGLAGAFAIREVIQGIQTLTDAAAVQEDAVNQLNTALSLTGEFTAATSSDLQAFASALQQNSTIGDEVVLSQLALAKSFGATNDQAKDLVSAAADLSAATGISLDSAVKNLGKTFGGLTGELGEVVPELRTLGAEALKSGEAINFVLERFGGAALAQTQTFSGAVTQLSNTFGDLQEEFGQIITQSPAITGAINVLNDLFSEFGKIIDENGSQASEFIESFVNGLVEGIPGAIRLFGGMASSIADIAPAIFDFGEAVGIIFDKIGTAIAASATNIETFINGIRTTTLAAVNGITQALNFVGIVSDEEAAKSTEALRKSVDDLKISAGASQAAFQDLFSVPERADRSGLNSLVNGIRQVGVVSEQVAVKSEEIIKNLNTEAQTDVNLNLNVNRSDSSTSNESINSNAAQVAADLEKATKEAAAFGIQLARTGLNAEQAAKFDLAQTLNSNLEKIRSFEQRGALEEEEATQQRLLLNQNFQNQIQALDDAAAAERLAIQQSEADAIIKSSQDAAAETAASRAELLSNITEGASQAFSIISQGVFNLASTILGGIENISTTADIDLDFDNSVDAINSTFNEAISNIANDTDSSFAERTSAQQEAIETRRLQLAEATLAAEEQRAEVAESNLQSVSGTLGSVASTLGDAVLPGLGGVVGGLLSVLSQPNDVLKEQIEGFANAIPEVIARIAENIPTILTSLATGFIDSVLSAIPEIINQLADIVPGLLIALVDAITDPAFIDSFVDAAFKFVNSLISSLPRIITSLIQAIPTLITALAQNLPQLIFEIINALPQIFNAIILAIPDIILALVDALPVIITGIIELLPEIITSLAENLILALPEIVSAFINLIPAIVVSLGEGILEVITSAAGQAAEAFSQEAINGAKDFLDELIDGITGVFDDINPLGDIGGGGGNPVSSALGSIGSALGLAEGGTIPNQARFNNDGFGPVMLDAGERVVSQDQNRQLDRFLNNQEGRQLNQNQGGPQSIIVQLQIGQEQLAEQLIQLNQNGFRTA